MKKVLFGLLVLTEAVKKINAAEGDPGEKELNYEELCTLKAPNPSEFGFVCLEPKAQKYLQCYLPGKVSLLMDCPIGTFCSAKAGEWTSYNPCG